MRRRSSIETGLLALLLVLVLVLALGACGGNDAAPNGHGASGTTGSAGGGGAGGGGACPAGAHAEGSGCAATLSGWTEGSSLASARDHHVTFAATAPAGAFLYVAGGANALTIMSDVERAPIATDGSLGAFSAAGKLPEGLAGPGFAQLDRGFALAGGLTLSGNSVTDTFVGAIDDTGALTFTPAPPMITSRYHVSLTADRGFVYAIGGLQQVVSGGNVTQKIVDAVERASFDGKTLGAFTALAPLPTPLTHHAVAVRDHALYVIGGIVSAAARTDILRATIDEVGALGAFEPAGQLPAPRATAAAFVFLDQLYVLGGSTLVQGGEVATVLRASFQADGTVGAFEELPPVPLARAHTHQAPLLDGTIYSAAGSLGGKYQSQVFLGHLQ